MQANRRDPLHAARVKQAVEQALFGGPKKPLAIGRYQVLDLLGAGAMSVVYAARDPDLGRTVAVKLLQEASDVRLVREARALAKLRHPHVVTLYDVGKFGDDLFLAMEHVEGAPLGRWARERPRTWREVLEVLVDVADGLAAVHEIGLVHRDVKPDNVVVDSRGSARLLDFGLVAESGREPSEGVVADGEPSVTRPGETPGTPRYMAPERRAGGPATPATDQYALAVTMEEVLETTGAPSAVLAIVRRGRSERPGERHPHVRAFRDALARHIAPPRNGRVLGLATLAAAVLGVVASALSIREDPCGAGAARIASRRARLTPRAEAVVGEAVVAAIDAYAAAWAALDRDVCVRAAASPPLSAAERAELGTCLDRRLAAFEDAIRALSDDDDARARAPDLVAELPSLVDCRPADEGVAEGADPPLHVELAQGTASEAARSAMQSGLRALRDADVVRAERSFEEAARIDGRYGAPLLWLAVVRSHGELLRARETFERAWELRAGMAASNRTLLAAIAPCIQAEPIDERGCEERLARAAESSPRNPYYWYELARYRWDRSGTTDEVVDAFARAQAADEAFVLARHGASQALAYLGRFDEALATIEECLRLAPGATRCLRTRMWIEAHRGECEAVLEDARRWRAATPDDARAYEWHARAALAVGEPLESVLELQRQSAMRQPADRRAFHDARARAFAAVLEGDFEAALVEADVLEATSAAWTDRDERLAPALLRIAVAIETGDREEARARAERALATMGAWTADPRVEDVAIARDDEPALLDALREAGAIDDAERAARRDAWLAAWRARAAPGWWPYLWLAAYGRRVDDASEAMEAEAAMAELGRPPFYPYVFGDSGIGRMLFFRGHVDDAITLLRRAAHGCHGDELGFGLEGPFDAIRASRDLGRALEAAGDRGGACEAYASVLARWGEARPRSLTADDARARLTALDCE